MSLLHGSRREGSGQSQPADVGTSVPAEQLAPPQPVQAAAVSPGRVPRTGTGATWVALIAAALLAVPLIVFPGAEHPQHRDLLWMTTSTPLAVALHIAAVGSVLLTPDPQTERERVATKRGPPGSHAPKSAAT